MNYTLIRLSSSIYLPNRNIKIKNYNIKDFKNLKPLSLKLSRTALALLKVDVYTVQLSPWKILTPTGI